MSLYFVFHGDDFILKFIHTLVLKIPQSIHQSLAALSKVIRGSQLLTPEVQKLASALLNQEVIKRTHNIGTVNLLSLLTLLTLLTLTPFTLLTPTLLTADCSQCLFGFFSCSVFIRLC